MKEELKKRENEIENEYIARIYRNRIEYGLNNSMCKDIINKELGYEKAESTYRGIAKILKDEGVDICHTNVANLYKEFLCELGDRIFNLYVEGEHPRTFDEIAKILRIKGLRVDEAKVEELYHQFCEDNGIDPDNP